MPLAPRVATSQRALVLGTFVMASVVSIPSSWAGTIVSNVADGILTVTGTADADDLTVRCEGGVLTVNQTQPSGGRPGAETCGASSCSRARGSIR